jgi:hypothetical protein
MPRPKTSVPPPLIAGVRGRTLSDLLRAWHNQPRKRSSGLFWGLVALVVGIDAGILLLGAQLFIGPTTASSPAVAERRLYVPHAHNAGLWEPLRHWVVRVDGQPRLFESFCRESVRTITGIEHFEGNDPVPVVASWMLSGAHESPDWEDHSFLCCELPELYALLCPEERSGTHVPPAVLRHSEPFLKILRGIKARGGPVNDPQLSPLEKGAAALENRLALFDAIRGGGVDGGDGEEVQTSVEALREAYHSGDADLFVAAVADLVSASRRALRTEEDASVVRRLACEAWLNHHAPFRWAVGCGLLASAFLTVARVVKSARRCFILSGLLASAACVGWAASGLLCRAVLHGGPILLDPRSALLWLSFLTLVLGQLLSMAHRDSHPTIVGAITSAAGFGLAECWWASGSVASPGDVWLTLQLLLGLSAFAALVLAWGISALTPLATRAVAVALVLLAAATALGVIRASRPGYSSPGWDAPALGILIALPCCAALLFVRCVGWLSPAGLVMALLLGITTVLVAWHVSSPLAPGIWVVGAALVNVALVLHAALRYYFGRQRVFGC